MQTNRITDIRHLNQIVGIYKVIGIDLTGSETKASGWAVLENGLAVTDTVFTDENLLSRIQTEKPDLVSIDCPLSLPIGRISVFDDDPGRQEFGINRNCEKMLLKKGIRAYPPLIKSMQKLTQRGILLAQKIKIMGFPVIESFPGGAQDILGIPRKQKGLPLLISGLAQFGIEGDFYQKKVVHDEIDALTSALVGVFFLSGNYESIGNEAEGCIIIPKLNASSF